MPILSAQVILFVSVLLPVLVALLCFILNRSIPTRLLALASGIVLLVAAVAMTLAQPLPLKLFDLPWLSQNTEPVHVILELNPMSRLFGMLILGGGGLNMFMLAQAVPPDLRRFGAIPGSLLLLIMAVFIGILNQASLLNPLLWMLATLASAVALRVSGPDTANDAPLIVLLCGAIAALLLLCCEVLLGVHGRPDMLAFGLGLLALMLAMGLPPLHAITHTASDAPSVVATNLIALGLPLLGNVFLLRLLSFELPTSWTLVLSAVGLIAMATCAAAGFGSRNAGKLLTWQHGTQQGMIMLVAAQTGLALSIMAPTLILVAALSTLASGLALAAIERHTGTSNLAELRLSGGQTLPGLTLLISSAAAAGIPGTWGFWGRIWFLNELAADRRWLVGPFLVASMLLMASSITPIAALLRRQSVSRNSEPLSQRAGLAAAIVLIPLILFGIAPHLAVRELVSMSFAEQIVPNVLVLAGMALSIILFITAGFLIAQSRERSGEAAPADQDAGPLPLALADSLRSFTWLARPSTALNMSWGLLLSTSQFLLSTFSRVENRYYIASLMLGLIVLILVFI